MQLFAKMINGDKLLHISGESNKKCVPFMNYDTHLL